MIYDYIVLCGVCLGHPIMNYRSAARCPRCDGEGKYYTNDPLPGQSILWERVNKRHDEEFNISRRELEAFRILFDNANKHKTSR